MRVLTLVAVGLMVAVAFAGCSSQSPGESIDATSSSGTGSKSATSSTSGTTASSSNSTTTGPGNGTANATNRAPTGSIAAAPTNGSAPLQVNFTLAANDPDGDAMSWRLVFGDGASLNGTDPSANVSHNYTAAGTFNVTYNVTDGKASANYSVQITVSAGAAPSSGQSISGSWQTGATGCAASWQDWVFGTPGRGVDFYEFDVAPSTIGKPFTATFTATGPALFAGVDFFNGATPAANVGGETDTNSVAPLAVSGTVPAGAVKALAFTCGAGASFVYQAG